MENQNKISATMNTMQQSPHYFIDILMKDIMNPLLSKISSLWIQIIIILIVYKVKHVITNYLDTIMIDNKSIVKILNFIRYLIEPIKQIKKKILRKKNNDGRKK